MIRWLLIGLAVILAAGIIGSVVGHDGQHELSELQRRTVEERQ